MKMFKKIRRFYWYHRDRGNADKGLIFGFVLMLSVIIMGWFGVRGILLQDTQEAKAEPKRKEARIVPTSGPATSEGLDESETEAPETESSVASHEESDSTTVVDTSGMTTFLGFMSEDAYNDVVAQIEEKCRAVGTDTAKKLDYQEFGATDFDVISYVLLGNGHVCRCNYNMQSCECSIEDTNYSESYVEKLQADQKVREEAALKEEQEKAKQAAKKEKAAKKKKNKSKKKSKKNKKSKS